MSDSPFRGFTPQPDCVRDELDVVAASVFGAVWRFGQMGRGQCDATLETIAERAGYRTTVTRERLRLLEAHGWIRSEARAGRPTVYHDAGRWILSVAGDDQQAKPQRQPLPPPQRVALAPQRDALPTPTPAVAPPQRVALPKIDVLREPEETKEEAEEEARERAAAAALATEQGPDAVHLLALTDMVDAFCAAIPTDFIALPEKTGVQLTAHARRALELGHHPADVDPAIRRWRTDLEGRRHERGIRGSIRPPTSGQVLAALVLWAATAPPAPLLHATASDEPWTPPLAAEPPPPPSAAATLWAAVCENVHISPGTFSRYFRPTRGVAVDPDGTLVVEVPDAATRDWLEGRLGRVVDDALRARRLDGEGAPGVRYVVTGEGLDGVVVGAERSAVLA